MHAAISHMHKTNNNNKKNLLYRHRKPPGHNFPIERKIQNRKTICFFHFGCPNRKKLLFQGSFFCLWFYFWKINERFWLAHQGSSLTAATARLLQPPAAASCHMRSDNALLGLQEALQARRGNVKGQRPLKTWTEGRSQDAPTLPKAVGSGRDRVDLRHFLWRGGGGRGRGAVTLQRKQEEPCYRVYCRVKAYLFT